MELMSALVFLYVCFSSSLITHSAGNIKHLHLFHVNIGFLRRSVCEQMHVGNKCIGLKEKAT